MVLAIRGLSVSPSWWEAHGGQWGMVGVSSGLSLQELLGWGMIGYVQSHVGSEGGSAVFHQGPALPARRGGGHVLL